MKRRVRHINQRGLAWASGLSFVAKTGATRLLRDHRAVDANRTRTTGLWRWHERQTTACWMHCGALATRRVKVVGSALGTGGFAPIARLSLPC